MKVTLVPLDIDCIPLFSLQYYVDQLNDPEVNKFLEIRFTPQTIATVREYIKSINPSTTKFFSIQDLDVKKDEAWKWVGNIKLGPINWNHRFGEIGILIFKDYWHKGYATEALRQISDYAFKTLHLHKVFAGVLQDNNNSYNAFTNAGFEEEYRIMGQYFINGSGHADDIVLSKFNLEERSWV